MEWIDVARRQAGVITRGQLRGAGASEGVVRGMLERRELQPIHPGVLLHRSLPPTSLQLQWAGALWSGGAISHRSAARHWQVEVAEARRIDVTTGDNRFIGRRPGVVVHRVALAAHEVVLVDGLPVTSRVRTVVDLLRTEPRRSITSLLDRCLQRGMLTPDDLRLAVKEQPGRTGNVRLRELLGAIEPGADAESERVLHRLLRHGGIRGWKPQLRVRLPQRTVYLDVGFLASKVAVEVDGRRHHAERSEQFEDDRIRQNALVAEGWTILRFTWRRLHDEPAAVVAEVQAALKTADPARFTGRQPGNLA